MHLFREIVIYVGGIIIFISFILAFQLRKKENIPAYFNFFYLMPLVGLILSINAIFRFFFNENQYPNFFTIQNSLDLVDFLLIGISFYKTFKSQNRKTHISIIFMLSIICIGFFILNNDIRASLFEINAMMNIAIFIFCLLYYFGLFNSDPSLKLANEPTFWIATGLFFYATVNLPLFAAIFILKSQLSHAVLKGILPFINIFIIVKHLFFIKGYYAATRLPKNVVITDKDLDYKFPG